MVKLTERKYALSDAEKENYKENGFLRFDALISGEKLAHYVSVLDEIVEHAKSYSEEKDGITLQHDKEGKIVPGRLHKLQGVCEMDGRMTKLAQEPEILDKVESLLGPNLDIFGTKFFPMLGGGTVSTGWHQDNYYFGTLNDGSLPHRLVSCGIYLQDSDRENGCLKLVPGSHSAGEVLEHKSTTGIDSHGQWTPVDEDAAIDVICPAGTVLLFSGFLLHGASRNFSNRTRYSTAWHYIPGDLPLTDFPRGTYRDRHIVLGK